MNYVYLLGPVMGMLFAAAAYAVRRYRKSIGRNLQPFRAYLFRSIRLAVGRYFNQALARQFGLRRYADLALAAFPSRLEVPSVRDVRLYIDDAYVRLSMSGTGKDRIKDSTLVTQTIGSALIFGEPGSGKSTLTRKLFREACKTAYVQPHQPSTRLPIHIQLRELSWGKARRRTPPKLLEWCHEELLRSVSSVRGINDPEFVYNAFTAGQGILLFLDGLDEVPSASLGDACTAVHELTRDLRQRSSRSTIIVTARGQLRNALPRQFAESFAEVYELDAFSAADVFAFLRRWPFSESRLQQASRIYNDLSSHATLAEMCTNPLILSMYVARDQARPSDESTRPVRLPDTRPKFYEDVVNELLLYRREDQLGGRTVSSQLQRARELLLGRIAKEHLLNLDEPANAIPWRRAVETAQRVLGLPTLEEAEKQLRQLAIDTGIFTEERRRESLTFMHLTLCEYLAAMEVRDGGENALRSLVSTALVSQSLTNSVGRRLWEVVIFAIALVGRSPAQTAVEQLESEAGPIELILRAIRESQIYESNVYARTTRLIVQKLAQTPPGSWDQNWFSQLRVLLTCVFDAGRVSEVRSIGTVLTVDQVLQQIVASDPDRFAHLFDMYLSVSPSEALRLADVYDVPPLLFAPDRLSRAMEQPELVALAMSKVVGIQSSANASPDWLLALGEAALRYELVAQTLLEESCPSELRTRLDSVEDQHAWHKVGLLSGSYYGAILALATSRIESVLEGYSKAVPRLGFLTEVSPQAVQSLVSKWITRSRFTRSRLLNLLVLLTGFTLLATYFQSLNKDDPLLAQVVSAILGGLVAIISSVIFFFLLRGRRTIAEGLPATTDEWYQALLNLRPNSTGSFSEDGRLLFLRGQVYLASHGNPAKHLEGMEVNVTVGRLNSRFDIVHRTVIKTGKRKTGDDSSIIDSDLRVPAALQVWAVMAFAEDLTVARVKEAKVVTRPLLALVDPFYFVLRRALGVPFNDPMLKRRMGEQTNLPNW